MDSEGRGVKRFQGSLCSLFCSYHLMVVTTADPICTSSIFLISQPASLPLSQFYIGSQVRNPLLSPLPFSSRLSRTYGTRYLPASNALYALLLSLDATSIFEREESIWMPYRDDTHDSGPRDQRGVEG